MGHIIGIDLGTCNSAVVLPEKRAGKAFFTVAGYEEYSVILDRLQRKIVPSVVALDEGRRLIVGHAAKARAGMKPSPIFFAKRSMGEAVTFDLGDRQLTPVEVSAEILKHLKQVAEEQLGEPVDTAVITVPAYFTIPAKQRTEEAARLAGLKVAQLVPEPVAAAIMYCAADSRDPLQVMTYDLGGGTFDVAILEKRGGQIAIDSIKASDGDRFLGGSDFDKALAWWMVDQLCQRGYDLRLNIEHPDDRAIFARLLVYAERAKIQLSKETTYAILEPSTGLVDHSGNPVSIELDISREQFESMIERKIEETIEICRRACAAATPPVKYSELDEILMVGGSSRIPRVAARLRAEFGREPRLIEPDLCVAMGAGIIARGFRRTSVGGYLHMDPIPEETTLPAILVAGGLDLSACPSCGLCRVTLASDDGAFQREVAPKEDGRFHFERVPTRLGERAEYRLGLRGSDGRELAVHRFGVKRITADAAKQVTGLTVQRKTRTNYLAKPIVVVWRSGPEVVVPIRTPLPFTSHVAARTTDLSGRIRIEIREDNTPLGEILMRDIPKTLPVGSEVDITLELRENYSMEAKAYVKALAKEQVVQISIPPRAVRPLAELQGDYAVLSARVEDALQAAGPGVRFGNRNVARIKERLGACGEMLAGPAPDAPAIQDCLDDIEGILRELTAGWRPEPSREAFDEAVGEAWKLYKEVLALESAVAQEGYDKRLEAIVREAEDAYRRQDAVRWKDGAERLRVLVSEIARRFKEDAKLPPPPQLKLVLLQGLIQLEQSAKRAGTFEPNRGRFTEETEKLKAIDVRGDPKTATADLVEWYQTGFMELKQAVGMTGSDGDGAPDRRGDR